MYTSSTFNGSQAERTATHLREGDSNQTYALGTADALVAGRNGYTPAVCERVADSVTGKQIMMTVRQIEMPGDNFVGLNGCPPGDAGYL